MGHYEPLRHYAEVHLKLEPLPRAAGCSLPPTAGRKSWTKLAALVLTHLEEKQHLGVLIGAPLTDMKITLIAGRAHLKHTEGGDFRQATYRAVRQGLMMANQIKKTQLLEPWYSFRLEVPAENIGRAMSDVQRMEAASTARDRPDGSDRRPHRLCTGGCHAQLPDGGGELQPGPGTPDPDAGRLPPLPQRSRGHRGSGYEPEHDLDNRRTRCSALTVRALWCRGSRCAAICTWTAAGATPPRQQKRPRPVPAGWRLTALRWKRTPNC